MSSFTFEGREIHAENGDTVLSALLRSGVEVENRCQAGACQSCLLRSGEPVPASAQAGLGEDLIERGAFLSCQAKAENIASVERLGAEVFPRHTATLVHKEFATDDVLIVTLESSTWQSQPGRFIRLIHKSGLSRPYSLAAPAWMTPTTIQLHVRIIAGGEMSERLTQAPVGHEFSIEGPFGKCAYRSNSGQEPILMIGTGTGLAPLYAIATDALRKDHKGPIHLYHGAATSSRLYYRSELAQLVDQYSNFHYLPCADQEVLAGDRKGSPSHWALCDLPDLSGFKVYLCGHPELVKAAQKKCFLAGANLKDIAVDAFAAPQVNSYS